MIQFKTQWSKIRTYCKKITQDSNFLEISQILFGTRIFSIKNKTFNQEIIKFVPRYFTRKYSKHG